MPLCVATFCFGRRCYCLLHINIHNTNTHAHTHIGFAAGAALISHYPCTIALSHFDTSALYALFSINNYYYGLYCRLFNASENCAFTSDHIQSTCIVWAWVWQCMRACISVFSFHPRSYSFLYNHYRPPSTTELSSSSSSFFRFKILYISFMCADGANNSGVAIRWKW